MVDIDSLISDIAKSPYVTIEQAALIAESLGGDHDVVMACNRLDMSAPIKIQTYLFALVAKKLKGGE
ncbi:MAG: hypothetical protein ACRCYB_06590 [Aeromonas veronii]